MFVTYIWVLSSDWVENDLDHFIAVSFIVKLQISYLFFHYFFFTRTIET